MPVQRRKSVGHVWTASAAATSIGGCSCVSGQQQRKAPERRGPESTPPTHSPPLPRPDRHLPKPAFPPPLLLLLVPIPTTDTCGQLVHQRRERGGGGEVCGGLVVLEVRVAAGGPVLHACRSFCHCHGMWMWIHVVTARVFVRGRASWNAIRLIR